MFVTGLSHSGKTELRLALDGVPDLCSTRSTYLWRDLCGRFGDLATEADAEAFLTAVGRSTPAAVLDPDVDALRTMIRNGEHSYHRLLAEVHDLFAERNGADRWVVQEAAVEVWGEELMEDLPDAIVIHLVRHPADRLASIRTRRRAYALKEGRRWRSSAITAARLASTYPDRYVPVRFEDLMGDPTATLRALVNRLGIPFDEGMVERMPGAIDRRRQDTGRIGQMLLARSCAGPMTTFGYS